MSRKRASGSPATDDTTTKRAASASPATDDTTAPTRRLVDRVVVDVGGTRFCTSTSTLTASSSYFQRLFSDRWASSSEDECFLDGDPEPFAILLSYMHRGHLDLPESLAQRVLLEAEFLGVDSLLVEVKARAHRNLHPEFQDSSDANAAASFDAEHGGLRDALHSGVLPARCYAPPPKPPPLPSPRWFSSSQRRKGCV